MTLPLRLLVPVLMFALAACSPAPEPPKTSSAAPQTVAASKAPAALHEDGIAWRKDDVDAAFDVLTTTESSMKGFRGGRVETYGSPEYAREMGVLLQRVDEFLAAP